MRVIKFFVGVCILILLIDFSFAIEKKGQAGFKFLDIAVGGRPAGMAGAFTMIEGNVYSLFYNPGGISWTNNKIDLLLNETKWIAGISYNAFGVIVNFGNWGTLGCSMLLAEYPKSIRTMVANNEQGYIELGEMSANAYSFGLAYSRKLLTSFSVGGRISYVGQELGQNLVPIISYGEIVGEETVKNKVQTLSYDVGTVFYPGFKSFRFGVSITNFSEQVKYEQDEFQLPLTFRLAGAMDLLDLVNIRNKEALHWLLDVEFLHHRDYSQRILVGSELSFNDTFFIRFGYKHNHDIEKLSFGIGIKLKVLSVDYSYSPVKYFGQVSRMSLRFSY